MWADVLQREVVVTQPWGCTDYSGEWVASWCSGGHFHAGIDLGHSDANPTGGDPIYATRGGSVVALGPWDVTGSFQYLGPYAPVILTTDGVYMEYGHVQQSLVNVGDRVQAGQLIAYMGNLGASAGAHLHVEVRLDGPYQGVANQAANVLDPIPYLDIPTPIPVPTQEVLDMLLLVQHPTNPAHHDFFMVSQTSSLLHIRTDNFGQTYAVDDLGGQNLAGVITYGWSSDGSSLVVVVAGQEAGANGTRKLWKRRWTAQTAAFGPWQEVGAFAR